MRNNIKVVFSGRDEPLPQKVIDCRNKLSEMTKDNTGVISNVVEISDIKTDNTLTNKEKDENNIATQEMIITVSTGRVIGIAVFVIALINFLVIMAGIKTGKIKRIYK